MFSAETKLRIAQQILACDRPFTSDGMLKSLKESGISCRRSVVQDVLDSLSVSGYVQYGYQSDGSYAFTVVAQPPAFAMDPC